MTDVFHALGKRPLVDHTQFKCIGADFDHIVDQREKRRQWKEIGEKDDVTELNDEFEIIFVEIGPFRLQTFDLGLRQGERLEQWK